MVLPNDLNIEVPSISMQTRFVMQKRALDRIHAIVKTLETVDAKPIPPSWNEFDKGYEPPSPDEIRETFKPYTRSQIAKMLGISDSRSVRRWVGGDIQIPYAAWRLFLVLTGRVF